VSLWDSMCEWVLLGTPAQHRLRSGESLQVEIETATTEIEIEVTEIEKDNSCQSTHNQKKHETRFVRSLLDRKNL